MGARFVNVDRDTPMLLPPSIQEWLDPNDMVHFVIDTVESMELPQLVVNHRGTGTPQYPPQMMLALLLYCYANGIMSSRKIEMATWHLIPVRYLTGDTHPDHDTINSFRKNNDEAIRETFRQLLLVAREMKMLKVGTVSIDGTHIKANASKYKNIRYDRIDDLTTQLDEDIDKLMAEAEVADEADEDDGQRIPEQIARREELRAKIQEAKAAIEQQAREKEQRRQDREDHDRDDEDPPKPSTKRKNPNDAKPEDRNQINLIDPDSHLMRKSRRDGWQQAYNAQAVVDADGSQLILASYVADSSADNWELEPALETVSPEVGAPTTVLADAGYVRKKLIMRFDSDPEAPELYLAITGDDHDLRRYDYRPPKKKTKVVKDPVLIAMREKVRSNEGRKIYQKRKQSVEPVFGIIKSVLGFDQFLRRGFNAVNAEWNLVCTAYNLKRMWRIATADPVPTGCAGG
ncbi:transposase [Alkalispirochaeta alkalica]|nr:transposase [Alkalispirochaeta alkalica]